METDDALLGETLAKVAALQADLARCRLQRDQTAEVLRKAQIEAGEDGNPVGVTRLLAERDEALAEVAAYQGRPEGALNEHWVYYAGWERNEAGVRLYVDQTGEDFGWNVRPDLDNSDEADRRMVGDNAPTPRAAMRAAEAKARELGLLP